MSNPLTEEIRALLAETRTIAVVGLSPKENRPSNLVARYLIAAGFTVVPVNPGQSEILGRPCYPNLATIPQAVDLVDIFRRATEVLPVVDEAIAIGAKTIWLQEGIINQEAATRARAAGLHMIMDRCLKVDHQTIIRGGTLLTKMALFA